MATLAADKARDYSALESIPSLEADYPVIASDIIYQGAAVGESSSTGTYRPLAAGDTFVGFCTAKVDNSAGAAAALKVNVRQQGYVWLTVTNGDNINDVGDTVYASDDDTFTTASTSNSAIGKIVAYDSTRTHKILVFFQGATVRSI